MVARTWEAEAENWLRWAKTPGHDAYWSYRWAFFDDLLPPAGRRTLEVGCGEGRVTRDLAAHGHVVTAVDVSPTLVRHAASTSGDGVFVLGDGAGLPFRDGSFDCAVAYNSLQVIEDMPGAVVEVGRTLRSGGAFAICVTHPMVDMGAFLSDAADAAFAVRCDYFAPTRVDDTVERDGLGMRFTGWTHTLEDYARALEAATLHITALREPVPQPGPHRYDRHRRVPMFLLILARKG